MTLLLEHYYRRGEARGADAVAAATGCFHLDTLPPPPPPIFATAEERGDGRLATEKSLDWSQQQSRDGIKPLTKKSTK